MCHNSVTLDLFDLDLRVTLTVSLLALVLLAAFLLEDNYLLAPAMSDDRGRDGGSTDLQIFPDAKNKGFDIDLRAGISSDSRYAKRLAFFDRELLAACSDNCVTHFVLISRGKYGFRQWPKR